MKGVGEGEETTSFQYKASAWEEEDDSWLVWDCPKWILLLIFLQR